MGNKGKRLVLFGAGQMGAMTARLVGAGCTALCFADNAEKKWGSTLLGLPVVSPQEALRREPDAVCLCVLDEERAEAMTRQLHALGYSGEILRISALELFDARLATMRLLAEQLREEQIPGDAAELGVFRGDFAQWINAAFPERRLCLFDTFEGFAERDVAVEREERLSRAAAGDFSGTGVELVRERLPHPEQAEFYKGWFPESFSLCGERKFAFVSIDADLYAPTAAALPLFYDRLSPGGVLMVHDVNSLQYTGAGKAVREFCRARGIFPMPVCDLHGSAVIRKNSGIQG